MTATISRAEQRLHEAEQAEQQLQAAFSGMTQRLDGLWELPACSVWSAISLAPAIAHALVEGRATAFAYPQLLGHIGPLLICSTAKPYTPGCQHRRALGVVRVLDDQPMSARFIDQLAEPYDPTRHRRQRIILVGVPRPVDPFYVKGEPGIYRIMAPASS